MAQFKYHEGAMFPRIAVSRCSATDEPVLSELGSAVSAKDELVPFSELDDNDEEDQEPELRPLPAAVEDVGEPLPEGDPAAGPAHQ